jgi:hypothetical protein
VKLSKKRVDVTGCGTFRCCDQGRLWSRLKERKRRKKERKKEKGRENVTQEYIKNEPT